MSRRHAIVACAAQLAEHVGHEDVALRAIPRGLPARQRADLLDLLTAAVTELRRSRPDVHARTIAGERLERGDVCELLFVVWEGERPAFVDEDGGER